MTLDELLADGRETIDVPTAGRLAFGVGKSQSFHLAAEGVLPVLELGERRKVVPVRRLIAMLAGTQPGEVHDVPPRGTE
jgi:hypothetical protein